MSLYNDLISLLPELAESDAFSTQVIILQNDSDGQGDYIAKWEYPKPLPEGMKVGKN